MKKVSFILILCLLIGLCSCRTLSLFNMLLDFPASTIWISEDQKIQLYNQATCGSIMNNHGELVAICVNYKYGGGGSVYLKTEDNTVPRKCESTTSPSDVLFNFIEIDIKQTGIFKIKINWHDTNGEFDESATELMFYPKASSETGFFKDPKLFSKDPEISFELDQKYYHDNLKGYLVKKDRTTIALSGDMFPYAMIDGHGAELYFYEKGHDDNLILRGSLKINESGYFFQIHESCVGTIWEPSITEFEMKPVAVAQEVNPN